ncbi:MAG: hypothetical protein JRE10_04090 [Deltaproteobacteria bacterium]|nr:hypothetical protein [Deltaproteobacteria bacterium]
MGNVLDASSAHGILFGSAPPLVHCSGEEIFRTTSLESNADYTAWRLPRKSRHMVHKGRRSATAEPERYGYLQWSSRFRL